MTCRQEHNDSLMTTTGHTLPAKPGIAMYFYSLSGAGGAERMICQLAGALASRGRRVLLVSWDAPGAKAYYEIHPSVQWLQLGFQNGMLDKLRRVRALSRQLTAHKIRALVGFVMSADKTVYAAAKLAGVKLVVAERNAPVMYRLRYNWWQRSTCFALMHLADRITVQMPGFAGGYPASLRRRIEAIPNPVPQACQASHPDMANLAGRFVLLAVTRLDSMQKRIDCLIKAFARIARSHPEWDIRIVGDGPEGAALRQLAADCGLSGRISFEPARANIFDVYVEAHLFAIPSLWEGFPNALAEALSHGLPAVGFAGAAGVADLIGDGAGWLAPGLDNEVSLARTLELAMSDGQERARRGSQAVRNMAAFAPQVQFDRWVTLLNEVAAESAR